MKKAFTLIELVVVILIIAILSVISFLFYSGQLVNTRDFKRVTDITTIGNFLNKYATIYGNYPLPDDYKQITFSGSTAWYQGVVSDGVALGIKLSFKPVDPFYPTSEYAYSVTSSKKQFELSSIIESSIVYGSDDINIGETANAALNSYKYSAITKGTYNNLFLDIYDSGSLSYGYYFTPSIILSDLSITELTDNTFDSGAFVINKQFNLPESYSSGGLTTVLHSFYSKPVFLGYYSGTISNDSIIQLMEKIKSNVISTYLVLDENNTIWKSVSEVESGSVSQLNLGTDLVSGLIGSFDSKKLNPDFNCLPQPNYINADFSGGVATAANQTWQDSNLANPCYYKCTNGYKGKSCSDHDGECGTQNGLILPTTSTITGSGACKTEYGPITGGIATTGTGWDWTCSGTGMLAKTVSCGAKRSECGSSSTGCYLINSYLSGTTDSTTTYTYSGKYLILKSSTANPTFKYWQENGGSGRILAANGQDTGGPNGDGWAGINNYYSTPRLTYMSGAGANTFYGRVCPANVYNGSLDLSGSQANANTTDRFSTGQCLYYDTASVSQTTNLNGTDGIKGFGASTSAKWFRGNVSVCQNKGMRLPVLYEINKNNYNTGVITNFPAADGVFPDWACATDNCATGVPASATGYTWTATSNSNNLNNFFSWYQSYNQASDQVFSTSDYIRCVSF